MHHLVTYFDSRYLLFGLALIESLREHSRNGFLLHTLCLDDVCYDKLSKLNLADVRLIRMQDFESRFPDLTQAKANRTMVEYYWTCTPFLPLYVLADTPDIDVITYLDSDLFFYDDPAKALSALGSGSILIVPHRYPDHMRSREALGDHNAGFVSFRTDNAGRECLQQWSRQCLEWCYNRTERGLYAGQKYLDYWPESYAGVVKLQHKGAGVDPWNVARYTISKRKGRVWIDDEELVFYHFSGLKIITAWLCDPGLQRFETESTPEIRKWIYGPYIGQLQRIFRQLLPGHREEQLAVLGPVCFGLTWQSTG
jgi:hypothetical protein